jgi:hypothetical protein
VASTNEWLDAADNAGDTPGANTATFLLILQPTKDLLRVEQGERRFVGKQKVYVSRSQALEAEA